MKYINYGKNAKTVKFIYSDPNNLLNEICNKYTGYNNA